MENKPAKTKCPHCSKSFYIELPEPEETSLSIGEISLTSKKPLQDCQATITKMLKDRTIKSYLRGFETKKVLGKVSYID